MLTGNPTSTGGSPLGIIPAQGEGMAKQAGNLKQVLIEGLNEDLNLELEAVLRYLYHSAAATGLLGRGRRIRSVVGSEGFSR